MMEKQIIWYNSAKSRYFFGTLAKFNKAISKGSTDIIRAEEFKDMPLRFVEKITNSLNSNLKELIMR